MRCVQLRFALRCIQLAHFFREVNRRFNLSESAKHSAANARNGPAEPALSLTPRQPLRQRGLGSDKIRHGFGLGQVHFAIHKGPLSELAGPGRTRPDFQQPSEYLANN